MLYFSICYQAAALPEGVFFIMLGTDFRTFLEKIKSDLPSEFVEVEKEISGTYETTAVITKLEMERRTPVVFFKNVRGADFPVVVNTCASRNVVAAALSVSKDGLSQKYYDALNNMIKPVTVSGGPVQEVVHTGD